MGLPDHKWIVQLRKLPDAGLFVDSRIIHAPQALVQTLVDDYRCGDLAHAETQLASLRASFTTLWRGKPILAECEINEVDAHRTRVRIRAGYGRRAEELLALLSVLFWIAAWASWACLISVRKEFQVGGGLSHYGPTLPLLVLLAIWLPTFTWIWILAFRPRRAVTHFYKYISETCGLAHVVEAPMRLPWSGFVQMIVVGVGLLAICTRLAFYLRPDERLVFFAILASLCALVVLNVVSAKSSIRWLSGQAAFAATLSLSLYLLFPLIFWSLYGLELREDAMGKVLAEEPGSTLLDGTLALLLATICGLLVLLKATFEADVLARGLDYWRSHPEGQMCARGWARFSLLLLILPICLLTGGLFWLAFQHSAVHCLSLTCRYSPWGRSIAFEQAGNFVGGIVGKYAQLLGLQIPVATTGGWLLFAFALPVLLWGCCHAVAFARDLIQYAQLWRLPSPIVASKVCAEAAQVCRTAIAFPPALRLDPSTAIFACTVIPPLPLLPQVIIVSNGMVESLPRQCLSAVLAHEMGHVRHGHTQLYALLRLISRALLLGPSFLTGLIKYPIALEAKADAFAVQWLESHGASRQDLIQALRLIEMNNVTSGLPRNLRAGISVLRSAKGDWLPARLRRVVTGDKEDGWILRAFNRWRLYHHLTFDCDLANYTYVSFSDRLRSISQTPSPHIRP